MLSKRFKHTASSGTDITDATATVDDVMTGKTAYIASGKITGSASPNPFPPFETLIPLSNLTVSFSHTIA